MITVTGAVSQTGLLTIKELIGKGVAAADIIAVSHDEGPFTAGGDLQGLGVQVRTADLTNPGTVAAALAGTEKLLLFPFTGAETYEPLASDLFARNQNVVAAANAAGATWIGYASGTGAQDVNAGVFAAHKQTEDLVCSTARSWTILRNGLQAERYGELKFLAGIDNAKIIGVEGGREVSAVGRADLAAAAAVVATGDGHAKAAYELVGAAGFSLTDLAALLSTASGKPIMSDNLPLDQYRTLLGNLLPADQVEPTIALESAILAGNFDRHFDDLPKLLGRDPISVAGALAPLLQRVKKAAQ